MVKAEAGPPVWLAQHVLQQHREVDKHVADEEEHRDDGCDDVDVACAVEWWHRRGVRRERGG